MGLFEKLKQGLSKTRDSLGKAVDGVLSTFTRIDDDLCDELEEVLLQADLGLDATEEILEQLKDEVKQQRVSEPEQIRELLAGLLGRMLEQEEQSPLRLESRPSVILVIGVNGVGKTTTIGKLAAYFGEQGKKVLLGAADTFRAAAADQLAVWAPRTGADLVRHQEGSDPAAVVFDSIAAGKSRGADIIICPTAGRLHNKKNLMDELGKISRVIQREAPGCDTEVLLVLDATTGQNALNQARQFKEAAGITGIILTKLDGTARGGVVIGIKQELQVPIKYIGVGEQIDDLRPFNAQDFVDALFGGREETEEDA